MLGPFRLALGAVTLLASLATAATSQERRPSHCIALAESAPGIRFVAKLPEVPVLPAAYWGNVPPDTVRITFIAHSSFLIETHGGLTAVTDYTGFIGVADLIPDVVTMNHAHPSHFTPFPDPAIPHVLRGWGERFGEGIEHHLDLGEMLVRNVSTDIRAGAGVVEPKGNSIFIFEVAGLCIAHLGHLHHVPSTEQYAALGRADVLMVPVDGGLTLPLVDMISVVRRLRSSIVLPMHWFSGFTLRAFADAMRQDGFAVVEIEAPHLDVSLRSLPSRPTVMIMRPRYLDDPGE